VLLERNLIAQNYWDKFAVSVRRSMLEWIFNARQTATGAKRIKQAVNLAEQYIRVNQYQRQ
jgi:uncharacterized protein YdeI (YjbR/CyaY-like superfamily)